MSACSFESLLFDVDDKGIALVTVNRPEVRNAMNNNSWRELDEVTKYVEETPSIRALIVTGAGEKAFVAGADIHALEAKTPVSSFIDSNPARRAVGRLESMMKPTIAAVNGYAFGGGCEIALACDIRIGSNRAKFALPETGIGVIPALGGTQRLAKCVGMGIAKDMILSGRVLDSDEALLRGLITYQCDQENLIIEAKQLASRITSRSPIAIALAKTALNEAFNTSIQSGLAIEQLSFSVATASEDKKEGVDAFLNKRTAVFPGA